MYTGSPVIRVAKLAWSSSRWRGFSERDYRNRTRYGYKYVRQLGLATEWWNFYEGFSDKYYYGEIPAYGRVREGLRAYVSLVLFISKNVYRGGFYFVGFYGDMERVSEEPLVVDARKLVPESVIEDIRRRLEQGVIKGEKYVDAARDIVEGRGFRLELRAPKKHSAVFLEKAYVRVEPSDLGLSRFGQGNLYNVDKEDRVEKAYVLLRKALEKHSGILESPEASVDEKREAREIIDKIRWALGLFRGLS